MSAETPKAKGLPTVLIWGAILGVLLVVLAVFMPVGSHPHPNEFKVRIIMNLRLLQQAVTMWELEHRSTNVAAVTKEELAPYLKGSWVQPVGDEEYTIGPSSHLPEARLDRRLGPFGAGTVFRMDTNGDVAVIAPK